MDAQKSQSNFKLWAAIVFLIIIIFLILIIIFKAKFSPVKIDDNSTIVKDTQSTVKWVGFYQILDKLIPWIFISIISSVISYLLYKYFMYKRDSAYSKKQCMRAAVEDLQKKGIELSHDISIYDKRIHAGNDKQFPGWGFIFVKKDFSAYQNPATLPPFAFVSTIVDAMNKDVFEQEHNLKSNLLKEFLNKQAKGKVSTPDWPVKPEKTVTFGDMFGDDESMQPEVNLNVDAKKAMQQQTE